NERSTRVKHGLSDCHRYGSDARLTGWRRRLSRYHLALATYATNSSKHRMETAREAGLVRGLHHGSIADVRRCFSALARKAGPAHRPVRNPQPNSADVG